MDILPAELISEVMLYLSDTDLYQLCRSFKQAKLICNSDEFWHDRYDVVFNEPPKEKFANLSWRKKYQLYISSKVVKVSDFSRGGIKERNIRIFPTDTIYQLFDELHTLFVFSDDVTEIRIHYGDSGTSINIERKPDLQLVKTNIVDYRMASENIVSSQETLPDFHNIYYIVIDIIF